MAAFADLPLGSVHVTEVEIRTDSVEVFIPRLSVLAIIYFRRRVALSTPAANVAALIENDDSADVTPGGRHLIDLFNLDFAPRSGQSGTS